MRSRYYSLTINVTARAAIEEEYARKLLNLCRKPLGSQETGTLRMSMDTVRGEVETMAKQHQSISSQMRSELEEPLAAFAGGMKERRKIVQNTVEKLLKTKIQQTQQVHKVSHDVHWVATCMTSALTTGAFSDSRQVRTRVSQDQGLSRTRAYGNGTRGTSQ